MIGVTLDRAAPEALVALRGRVLGPPGTTGGLSLPGDHADDTRHWVARRDGQVIACASVMPIRGWALRAMAVAPEVQRQGIGAALLARVMADVADAMWCNARLDAVPFYEASGWVVASPVFTIKDAGAHRRMVWNP